MIRGALSLIRRVAVTTLMLAQSTHRLTIMAENRVEVWRIALRP